MHNWALSLLLFPVAIWIASLSALISLVSLVITLRTLRRAQSLDTAQRRSKYLAQLSSIKNKGKKVARTIRRYEVACKRFTDVCRRTNRIADYEHVFDKQERYYKGVKAIALKIKALDDETDGLEVSFADLADALDIEKEIGNQHDSLALMDNFIDEFECETQYLYDEISVIA